MTAPLLIAGVQVREQRVAEIEELLRDRLVPVGLERPGLERTQECGESAGAEPDRPRGIGSAEAGSEMRGLLDMLESSHQGLARVPAEGHRSPVERDGDAVEAHRHGGDGRRTGRRRPGHKWAHSRVRA